MPLLHALCNPGLRERHWSEISNIIGFEMGPDPSLTLNKAGPVRTPSLCLCVGGSGLRQGPRREWAPFGKPLRIHHPVGSPPDIPLTAATWKIISVAFHFSEAFMRSNWPTASQSCWPNWP